MKKLMALLLAGAMALSMVACGGSEPAPAPETNEPAGMKIAIVSSPSGVDDGNFNETNYNGILAFIEEHPEATVTPVREETGDVAAAIQAVADIVADYDAIVCCGFQFAGIATLAEENPDVKFILVDTFPSDANGAEVAVDNIYAMTFREQESGFLQGITAAMQTATGKVAMINGIAYPSNVNYQFGFESGVNYANKYFGTSAEVVELAAYAGTDVTGANVAGNYVGNFSDEAGGKVLAEALMSEGCDIIVQACGASGNGVLTACKEAEGVYSMGSDVDQFDDGVVGDRNIILTSALKVMDKNVKEQLEKINDGTFVGGNYLLGADTDSTGYVSAEGRHQLTAETMEKLDEAFAKIKSGEIVPAANFNGYTPDAFPGL
ncbi:MAG: BMP family ABC transporter substrate-binding protein [Oscillospiraceae bacterium]|nr:BMP family ABC transporter substrate-binding protein [Oscillospiraceae bacterium]